MRSALGRVVAIRRYPVKSMLGEDLPMAELTDAGLLGDRRFALVHRETGRVASAKHPRLWRDLLTCTAAYDGDAVRITLPDGNEISSADPLLDEVLSELTAQPVRLTGTPPAGASLDRAVPEEVLQQGVEAAVPVTMSQVGGQLTGSFVDFAGVHLLTTSTVDHIAARAVGGTVEPERYRPNVVIQADAPEFSENDWYGRDIRIGDDTVLQVVARTPRCAVPTLAHGALSRQPAALRVPATHNRVPPIPGMDPEPCAGAYAEVRRAAPIAVGDPVWLAD